MRKEDKSPKCPYCGETLEIKITVNAHWGRKIKKDGTLHKVINRSTGTPTDIIFLKCPKYMCNFYYDVSTTPEKSYPLLDEWIDEHYEEIRF